MIRKNSASLGSKEKPNIEKSPALNDRKEPSSGSAAASEASRHSEEDSLKRYYGQKAKRNANGRFLPKKQSEEELLVAFDPIPGGKNTSDMSMSDDDSAGAPVTTKKLGPMSRENNTSDMSMSDDESAGAPVTTKEKIEDKLETGSVEKKYKESIECALSEKKKKQLKNVNRIVIAPLREERTRGSISSIVLQKLLQQYQPDSTFLDRTIHSENEYPASSELEIDLDEVEEEKEPASNTTKKTETPSPAALVPSPNRLVVHDIPITSELKYRGQKLLSSDGKTRIHDPLSFEYQNGALQPSVLLSTSSEIIPVLNRRTGFCEYIAADKLPERLLRNAALEPIIEHSPYNEDSCGGDNPLSRPSSAIQLARSSSQARVSTSIRRQTRPKTPLKKGEYLSIQEGPHAGKVGIFQSKVKGNWAILKLLGENHDTVVDIKSVSRFSRRTKKKRKKKEKNVSMTDVMGVYLREVFSQIDRGMTLEGAKDSTGGLCSQAELYIQKAMNLDFKSISS